MTRKPLKKIAILSLATGGWLLDRAIGSGTHLSLIATTEAVVGAPATPVNRVGVR
jgi:hypothetical protein